MFLRIGVAGGGCSGFNYTLGFDDKFDEATDSRYEHHGVAVVVDKKSALYLDGTTVDWYHSIEKQGFTFNNPNAVKTCGCGSSFFLLPRGAIRVAAGEMVEHAAGGADDITFEVQREFAFPLPDDLGGTVRRGF